MKSLNITLLLILTGLSAVFAQNYVTVGMNPDKQCNDNLGNQSTVPFSETHLAKRQAYLNSLQNNAAGSRAVTTTPIGSSGNLFTIIDGSTNCIDANNDLGVVTFIHRTDPSIFPSNNVGQYRYDVSQDGGQTWSINNGLLNPSGNQLTLAGRFPQAVIHNPLGNTNPNNAYLAYQGTWLPFDQNGDWDGLFGGVARLDNDSSTFTETVYNPNNNNIDIAKGMCRGVQNVFWSVGFASVDGSPADADSIIIYKGTFNSSTNDVDWVVDRYLVPGFDKSFDGSTYATSLNMGFNETGQYGYVFLLGDVTPGGDNVMDPVLYNTNDGGQTWTGPIALSLADFPNVVSGLSDTSAIPTCAFDCDVAVDKFNNPHIAVVVGMGSDYSITTNQSDLKIYDITYDRNSECGWQAIFLSDVETFRGDITSGVSEDNRPQASISPDGDKVFISWLDSDPLFTGGTNEIPDFHVRGIDVENGLATTIDNWTEGDPIWGGGALFGSMSQNSLEPTSGTYNLPVVFTRLNASGSDADPTSFHYVQDITYTDADFTIDIQAPIISLNGNNPVSIVSPTPYVDAGITAEDNVDGTLTGASITTDNPVDVNTPGTYFVTYYATDAAGNVSCELVRTVRVLGSPDVTPPTITLIGNDTITVESCAFFVDPGATATDNIDGDISSNIQVTSTVDTGVVGLYTLTYNVADGSGNLATPVVRYVDVVTTAPSIQLSGASSISVEVCQGFNDPGATGSNSCGPLPVTISSSPTFDANTTGTYTFTYTVDDGVNAPVSVTRTVNVTPDVTGPVFTLLGDNPDLAYLGEAYSDPGVIATDCVQGVVNVDTTTTANTTARATVQVVYSATDGANSSTATRDVIVNTEPDPAFTFVVNGGTVNLTDDSRYSPTKWSWTAPTQPTRSSRNASYTFSQVGTYSVCLEVENEWNARFSKPAKQLCQDVEILTVGINEADLNRIFKLYPNPTESIVNINYSGLNIEEMTISVYSMVGKEIFTKSINKVNNSANIELDLSGNANGIYLVRIQTDKGAVTKRVNLLNK